MRNLILSTITVIALIPETLSAACRSVSDIRIDSSDDVKKYEDVCEAQNITIFADSLDRVILPNIKRVGLVNIDSRALRAVALPDLELARDIYIQGSGVEVAEFPSLKNVSGRFVVLSQPVKFLNLPELTQVGRLIIQGCGNLEFVFADKLQSIGSAELSGNSRMNENVVKILENLTVLTPEQYANRQAEAERMRLYRQQLLLNGNQPAPIRPTGHPTHFRDYVTDYYVNYPAQYHDYWYTIGPWGFWLWHRL